MSFDIPAHSFAYDNEIPTRHATQRHFHCTESFNELRQELNAIKKDLKAKVSRSQFCTSLSGKLSISQISSMPTLTFRNNENINAMNDNASHVKNTRIENLLSELNAKLDSSVYEFKEELSAVREMYNEVDLQIIEDKSRFNEKIKGMREQISELEAYAYSKADRSELDKLFTLNELLVIEIEQAKQQTQDFSKELKSSIHENSRRISQIAENQGQKSDEQFQYIKENVHHFKEQIDRIMDLLELRESETQSYRQNENQTFFRWEKDIGQLREKFKKIELEHPLQVRELLTRISVVELKETQINRAAKEVDGMRNQIETIRLDIHTVADRVGRISQQTQASCRKFVFQEKQTILKTLQHQLKIACEEIMKKVIQMTENFASSEDYNQQISTISLQNQKVYDLALSNEHWMRQINDKIMQLEDQAEQEIEKTEERISNLNKGMQEMLSMKKMKQILRDLVTCEELTQIAKEIDRKISVQMKKIVDEQLKVNEVLCSETIVAKWFWSSGQFKGGNLVTWDKQVVNTLPENFRWVKGEPVVCVNSSGYYQVEMGFYSKKKPTVQIIVNGQTVVSAVNSSSYVLHHSSGKLKEVGNSQISGLTYVDYLLLPENARIAISYVGECSGQGFLSFKRV